MRRRIFSLLALEALASALEGCLAPRASSPPEGPSLASPAPRPEPQPPDLHPPDLHPPAGSGGEAKGLEGEALYQRFPGLGRALPRAKLVEGPTPLEPAKALGDALGLERLFIKRDDLAGVLYGGNKTRKLELELGRALADGAREVITSGAIASNHALATALYARSLGLRARVRLLPQPPTDDARRHLLALAAAGAAIEPGHARGEGPAPPGARVIAPGGSSPLGNIGYVAAGFELASQIEAGLAPEPDVVFVAMGTMGCSVGLALGLAAAGLRAEVRAVQVSSPRASGPRLRDRMAAETVSLLRSLDPTFPEVTAGDDRLPVVTGYVGRGYGLPTDKGQQAASLFGRLAGVELETTYTGKALAALIDQAPSLRGKTVLFWNTYNSRPLTLAPGPESLPARLRGYF